MPTSYNIVPVLQTPDINPGDTVRIEIFISGAGEIGRRCLHILHPYRNLFEENVGKIFPGLASVSAAEVDDEDITILGEGEIPAPEVESGYVARSAEHVDDEYGTVHKMTEFATMVNVPD